LRGTKFYDGEYTESPALTAYEFALPRVNEDKGTAAAALDFVQYFTSPEAQQLLIAKGNILSPLRGMPASPRLEPFLRRMNRRGTHRNVFNPYEINIIKEPYWAESRAKVLDEINSLLGNIPNFEFYHRATGGDQQAYAQWRETRFNTFLDNLQTHFKWACQRLITEYSEDRRHALRRDQRRWLAALRAATPGMATTFAVPDATLQGTTPEQLWRIVLDDWDVITTCENMLPTLERDRRAMPPALSAQRLRMVARSLQVGLALAAAGLLIGLAWSGVARSMLREARLWVWLAPTLLLLGLFSYYPALSAIYHAFFRWNGAEVAEFIGWDNFRALLADGVLWHGFRLALVFMAANVLKFLPTVAIAVVLFHLASKRAQYMFRVAFVLPLLIPWMVVMLMWKYIYRMDGGLLNTLLIDMGWLHLPVNWLGQTHTVVPSLLMIGFPFISTIGVLILLAGLQAIPETVFEAATLDGCGPLRRFWTLEMPLIAGQLKLNLVLITIQTIQEFALPLVLTRGGPNHASMLPGLWMYFNAFSYGKMGYAAAIGVVMFIVILGFTMLHLRLIRVHRD
jgi:raffinose/stachyose/melibiose transport system permease protein